MAPGAAPRGGDCGEICLHSLPEFPQIFLPLCRSHLKCYYIIHYLGDFQRLTSSTQARDGQSRSSWGGTTAAPDVTQIKSPNPPRVTRSRGDPAHSDTGTELRCGEQGCGHRGPEKGCSGFVRWERTTG